MCTPHSSIPIGIQVAEHGILKRLIMLLSAGREKEGKRAVRADAGREPSEDRRSSEAGS